MSDTQLHVGLSSWIIQDGNYPDFACGETVRFALEFYSEGGLSVARQSHDLPALVHRHDARYETRGIVRFCSDEVWVVDFGGVMAFSERLPTERVKSGSVVTGEIYLGIDPFFYFEYLHAIKGIPPLIYEWQIDGIEMETAPFITSSKREVLVRDDSKRRRVAVEKTNAWEDDSGNADYVLVCHRVSPAPSRDRYGRVEQ